MANRIRTALRWLGRSLQVSEAETQFLHLAIALEAIFTARSSDYKISALIRDCASRAATWADVAQVRKLVNDLYGRRSGIVHQGSIKQFTQEIDELHIVVVQCIREMLAAGDHRNSYESMLARLGLNLEDYRETESMP